MYNGVKQGGVITCHLFNLYIDPLLVQLSNSGYGCHIAGVYAGALSYANDITLLSSSVLFLCMVCIASFNCGQKS